MLSAVSGEPFIQDKTELSRQESLIHPSIHSFIHSSHTTDTYQVHLAPSTILGHSAGDKDYTCSHQTDVLVGRVHSKEMSAVDKC